MRSCKEVVDDFEVFNSKEFWEESDSVEKEALFKMLGSAIREEVQDGDGGILQKELRHDLEDGNGGEVLVMVHVVDHKGACFSFHPGAGSEERNLEMPPMCCLDFVLFLDFGILTEVKLEEALGGKVHGAQIVELLLLVSLDQYVHLEALQVLA